MPETNDSKRSSGLQMFRALKQRSYRWFWFSGLGMTAAQGVQQLAIAWLVLELTDSVGQLGLVIFMQGVPMAMVALFGGVLADRYDRRRLLIAAQFVTMANLFILAVLAATNLVEIWHVYLSSVGLGVMQSVTMPARTALIRSLVDDDDMVNAVALNAMQMHSSRILWPSLAGALISLAGIGATIFLSAACSLGGILCLLVVRGLSRAQEVGPVRTSPLRQLGEGLRYVQSTLPVYTLMALSLCCGLFGLAFMNLAPAFAREELGLNAGGAGLFMMSMGIGAILGSAMMLVFPGKNGYMAFVWLVGVFGINLLVLAANPWLPGAFLIMGFFGFSNSALVVVGQTFLQINVPQGYLGRVIGLWSLAGGLGFITALPIGLLGDAIGLRWAIGGAGVLLVLSTLWFGLITPLRTAERVREVSSTAG
jgi:MFS family permease